MQSVNSNSFKDRFANASEEWRVITEYDKYEVSNKGRVRNIKTVKILSLTKHDDVLKVGLCGKKEGGKHLFVYRLVGQCFLPNDDNLPTVNHIDKDVHNNHFTNLRWGNNNQIQQYKKKISKNTTSKYKGVSWDARARKWKAMMRLYGSLRALKCVEKEYLGLFEDERDAALIYNLKAIEYYGEFANLNKIE